MQNFLQELVLNNVFVFVLILTRIGTIISIMPGIGDSFVPANIRAMFAIAFSFILTPVIAANIPHIPSSALEFGILIISEAFIGIFIGTIMKVLMSALNIAGEVASVHSGLANATVFNPSVGSQGAIISAIYSVLGVTLIMVTDLHHFLITSAVYSYKLFPTSQGIPDITSMTEAISMAVNMAYVIGVEIAMPFIIVITILHLGTGLLGRLMPQMQIYFVAIPIQLAVTLLILSLTVSYGLIYWISAYEEALSKLLN